MLTAGWSRIDRVVAAISPGARAPRGLSVVRAILSWVGRPVRVFEAGAWRMRPGWGLTRRMEMPGLGGRWLALAETPDLDLLTARFTPRREALFLAGLELSVMHLGLALLAWPVRLGAARSLKPMTGVLKAAADGLVGFGSDRGGMVAEAAGADADGLPVLARWSLWAEQGAGPSVPIMAAAAVLRGLVDGRLSQTGARACTGLVSLDEILAQAADLPIGVRLDRVCPGSPSFWRRVLGPAFDALPEPVRRIHAGTADETFHGRAVGRGSGGLAALARRMAGMPKPGRYPTFSVRIAPNAGGEAWTRAFGRRRFGSVIGDVAGDPGRFEERVGPVTFRFETQVRPSGFVWRFLGWRLGPLPLPKAFAPRIRARSFARDGVYRFSVLTAHPLAGVIAAYAGRLGAPE